MNEPSSITELAAPVSPGGGATPRTRAKDKPNAPRFDLRASAARFRKGLRGTLLVLYTLLALLIGLAYPALARGDEILHASWQNRWYLLGLIVVPAILYRATLGEDRRMPRLKLGTLSALAVGPSGLRVWLKDLPGVLRTVGFALCVLALARPVNTLRPQAADEEGIDIVVVLDLSGSMRAAMANLPADLQSYVPPKPKGVRPTRIDAAKAVIRDFIARRKTDRIGVVVFGSSAYVLSPPTLDYHLLDELVAKMELNVIDSSSTAIGDAVGVASARLRRSHARSKAIILLTDGDSNGGKVSPEYSAHLANSVGARLYTIQIGQGDAADVQDGFDLFGQPHYVSMNFPVNPKLLKELAAKTGGSMYVATDAQALQASFHDVLDKLEKTKFEANIANYEDLFAFLLLPGVLLLACDAALRALVLRRFP
ncbi:MAG TPA: VWA domain-containing protein [Polyangiaceae bacterium]|jgi:Ca-activated chloride channel family protein|nr:VWA domain-containing protein [Polyangiaceae bacterium]